MIGVPEAEWGEAVVACYPAEGRQPDLRRVTEGVGNLAGSLRPKHYVKVTQWPTNDLGKVNRAAVMAAAAAVIAGPRRASL